MNFRALVRTWVKIEKETDFLCTEIGGLLLYKWGFTPARKLYILNWNLYNGFESLQWFWVPTMVLSPWFWVPTMVLSPYNGFESLVLSPWLWIHTGERKNASEADARFFLLLMIHTGEKKNANETYARFFQILYCGWNYILCYISPDSSC